MKKTSLALICVFAAAWIAQTFSYLPVADDFPFARLFQEGMWRWVMDSYAVTGIRLSFSLFFNGPLYAAPPWCLSYVLVALHLVATLLLFYVCRLLARDSLVAYVSALLFGVFPFGYGAVVWACGSYIIPNSIFFLGGIAVLLRYSEDERRSQWTALALSSLLLFTGCIAGEHVVFASAFVGLLALANSDKGITAKRIMQPWVLAPFGVVGFYLLLAWLTKPDAGLAVTDLLGRQKSLLSSFNPNTLASVWYYQWRNTLFFVPWSNFDALVITIKEMGAFRAFAGLSLLIIGLGLIRSEVGPDPCPGENRSTDRTAKAKWWLSPMAVLLLMMLGVSGVHALVGGYSASARHQYVPLLMCALFLSAAAARWKWVKRLLYWRRAVLPMVLSVVGVATTWMICSIYRYEMRTYTVLCDYLALNPKNEPIRVIFDPPLYNLWPFMAWNLGFGADQEWVLNEALRHGHGSPPVTLSDSAGKTVVVDRRNPHQPVVFPEAGN